MSGNAIVDSSALYYLYTNIIFFVILIILSTPAVKQILKNMAQKYRDKTKPYITNDGFNTLSLYF